MLIIASQVSAIEFSDDFTTNAYTQANWAFFSPYECLNSIFQTNFGGSGIAGNGSLCMNSSMASEPFFSNTLGVHANNLIFGNYKQPIEGYNVSVFAGVTFTPAELNGNDSIVKALFLRGDIRSSPSFPFCNSTDGGDAYFLNMDPHSRGENRFSILKYVSGDQIPVLKNSGFIYDWPANVHHNVYFGASWDTTLQTNRLRAILYLNDIHDPIYDLQVHDVSLKPDNLDPGNNGNLYAGLAVSNDNGHLVNSVCLTTASPGVCGLSAGHVFISSQSIDLDTDTDSDNVLDACDLCPNTVVGASVDAHGCPNIPGDFDRDGDVDDSDLAVITACRAGAGVPIQNPVMCNKANLYPDQTIDMNDFAVLQRCYSGANVPANPACAGP